MSVRNNMFYEQMERFAADEFRTMRDNLFYVRKNS